MLTVTLTTVAFCLPFFYRKAWSKVQRLFSLNTTITDRHYCDVSLNITDENYLFVHLHIFEFATLRVCRCKNHYQQSGMLVPCPISVHMVSVCAACRRPSLSRLLCSGIIFDSASNGCVQTTTRLSQVSNIYSSIL